jgi:hypothetical protein
MTDSTTIAAAATASGVHAWKKALREIPNQTAATATDIGWVRNNDSRLNVVSSLSPTDKQQFFKFKALSTGKFGFGDQTDKNIRIQVYDPHNRVVADSKANMGVASTNFEAMKHSNYDIKPGNYVIKVTRDAGVAATDVVHFAMQMKIGTTYKNDYVTTQVALTQDQLATSLTSPQSYGPASPSTSIISSALSMQTSLLGGVDLSGGAAGFFGIINSSK